jgi:hypothetical protein
MGTKDAFIGVVLGIMACVAPARAEESLPMPIKGPSRAEMFAAYPVLARGEDISRGIDLECELTDARTLTNCTADAGSSGRYREEFRAAALSLAPRFVYGPDAGELRGKKRKVKLHVSFSDNTLGWNNLSFDGDEPLPSITPAKLVRSPTREELNAGYPPAAIRADAGASVFLVCDVSVEAVLSRCKAKEERSSYGYATAALALAPKFLVKPATKGGKPIPSKIKIRLVYEAPNLRGAMLRNQITNASWTRVPTMAEIYAVFPPGAVDLPFGTVVVECKINPAGKLQDCVQDVVTPKRRGFDLAAKKLMGLFQVGPAELVPAYAGNYVTVTLRLPNPTGGAAATPPRTITDAVWEKIASEPSEPFFPPEAAQAGVKTGRAVIECTVDARGALSACAALSEDPANLGFTRAAFAAANIMRLNLWTPSGLPAEGARIKVPFKFTAAEKPVQSSAPSQ